MVICQTQHKKPDFTYFGGMGIRSIIFLSLLLFTHVLLAQGPAGDTVIKDREISYISGDFELFDEVLEQFRGKVVLLDFWATWCRPCIQEFPHYDKIYSFLESEPDVVLLYVSLDGDREKKWHDFVEKKELNGQHFLASREIHLELYEEWEITTIPRYMIIGRDGEVIEKHASRPSQGKALIRQLDKALGDE